MRARARNRSARGFTLLELLVALAILAMSLGLLYRAAGTSARNVGDLERHQGAVLVAQSVLAMRDAVSEQGWDETGESAGYAWRVSSTPYATQFEGPNVPVLHQVHVVVSWGDGPQARQLELDTLLPQGRPPDAGARS